MILAVTLAGCGSSFNAPPLPQSDICDLAPGAPRPAVTAVEIGRRPNGVFAPIVEDSVVELVLGGQGSDMVVASLRITGTGLTSCMAQETIFEEANGDLHSSESAPMATIPAGPDVVVSGDILLPFYGPYGTRVRIRADVNGTTDTVEFWAGSLPQVDAAPDA